MICCSQLWLWAGVDVLGCADVLGRVILVNVIDDGVNQQLALIAKQGQLGANSFSKVGDDFLLRSKGFEQNFKGIDGISAHTAMAREFQVGNLLDDLLGGVGADLHGIADVSGSIILVNVSDNGVNQQLALVAKQGQVGADTLNEVDDLLLLRSESLEQDLKGINGISAHLTLAWEFNWSNLNDLLGLRANIDGVADVSWSIVLVNVSNNGVNQLLALVTEQGQLSAKIFDEFLHSGFLWAKGLEKDFESINGISAHLALSGELNWSCLLDDLLGFWASLDGIADVCGRIVLVNVVDNGVHQQFALVAKQRQVGAEPFNKVSDFLFLWSKGLEKDLKGVDSISADLALAREKGGHVLVWQGALGQSGGEADKGQSNQEDLHGDSEI